MGERGHERIIEPGYCRGTDLGPDQDPVRAGDGVLAVTAGFFVLGSYLGRHLSQGWAFVWFIPAFACLTGINFTVRRSATLTAALLSVVGTALGLAMAPTLV